MELRYSDYHTILPLQAQRLLRAAAAEPSENAPPWSVRNRRTISVVETIKEVMKTYPAYFREQRAGMN